MVSEWIGKDGESKKEGMRGDCLLCRRQSGFDGNDAIRSDDQSAHSHGRDNAG